MTDAVAAIAATRSGAIPPGPVRPPTEAERAAAEAFEAAFLAEMMRHTGLGDARDAFGGGAGERQFAPFLARAQAEAMARAGGIGLADRIAADLAARAR